VLLLLSEHPYHGYALRDTLDTSGLVAEVDFGNLYRTLRRMEASGLVTSQWEQGDGPGRRVYSITDSGRRYLVDVVVGLKATATSLHTFLTRYQRQEESIHHADARNADA
jgi:poly-beta-hydroxybutyrate-responsive repressor